MTRISNPPVRYYGGKWRLGKWVISHFPPHVCYVESFAGGASCLFQKRPARFEVLNDLNGDVINFFEVLRSRTEEFVRAVQLTPYGREELRRAVLAKRKGEIEDPIERARNFYIRCWMSFGSGVGKSMTGWRYQIGMSDTRTSAIGSWNRTEHLWAAADRLKWVQIECDDAYKVTERFDSEMTLHYWDLPYVHSTRNMDNAGELKGYAHELSDGDHRRFAELARRVKGFVIVSGYPSKLYDELYEGWQVVAKQSSDLKGNRQTECLWLSPRVTEMETLPLFLARGGGVILVFFLHRSEGVN